MCPGKPMKEPIVDKNDLLFLLLMAALVSFPVYHWWLVRKSRASALPVTADGGTRIIQPVSGKPGSIFGRSRRCRVLMATSRKVPGCFVDPSLLKGTDEVSDLSCRLGAILGMNPGEVYSKIALRSGKRFAWVKRELEDEEAAACLALPDRAVGIKYEWRREYPCGNLAGTVIGARRWDNMPVSGIEQALHRAIRSAEGRQVFCGDAFRKPLSRHIADSVDPADGRAVHLTIDVNIQQYLQDAVRTSVEKFDAAWGTGVVVDPGTGDILAMTSCPTFDPNHYNRTPVEHMANRAVSFPYEPGSVLKPVLAAAAVEEGVVNYGTRMYCENGVYHAPRGGRISDHGKRYAYLSVEDGVVYSSNILMAKVGEKLGNRRMHAIVHAWGLGRKTGIALPGESGGIVRPLHTWDGYSLRRVPFGQEISVTALQLAMAFASIANNGVLMRPRLVTGIVDPSGETLYEIPPRPIRRVLSPANARRTLAVLHDVVERGTGKRCRLDSWNSWGKTGTAQVAGRGGYLDGAYTGTFVGGAPVEKTRVICLISIYRPDRNKGYYGGVVAAPYVKDVLEKSLQYLDVPNSRSSLAAGGR